MIGRSIVLGSVVALGVAASIGCTQVNVTVPPTTTDSISVSEPSTTFAAPSSGSTEAPIQTADDGVLSVTEWKSVQSSLEDQGISTQWSHEFAEEFGLERCDQARYSTSGELSEDYFRLVTEAMAKQQEIRNPGSSANFSAPQWAKVAAAIIAKMCLAKAGSLTEVRRQQ